MSNNDINIHCLADAPKHGPIAIEWIYNTWGAGPGKNLEDVRRKAYQYCNRTTLPIMFVATLREKPVGYAGVPDYVEGDLCVPGTAEYNEELFEMREALERALALAKGEIDTEEPVIITGDAVEAFQEALDMLPLVDISEEIRNGSHRYTLEYNDNSGVVKLESYTPGGTPHSPVYIYEYNTETGNILFGLSGYGGAC